MNKHIPTQMDLARLGDCVLRDYSRKSGSQFRVKRSGALLLLTVLCLSGCQSDGKSDDGDSAIQNAEQVTVTTATENTTSQTDSDVTATSENEPIIGDANPVAQEQSSSVSNSTTDQNEPSTGENLVEISEPTLAGDLFDPDLNEVSGVASSLRYDNVLWMVNDSGGGPRLFAVNADGSAAGDWVVDTSNYDWEDMSSTWINGEAYLLIADIGDNRRAREFYRVDVMPEPYLNETFGSEEKIIPVASIKWQYPDGSHNAEAMTTDGEWIYIITKGKNLDPAYSTNAVYRVPLSLEPEELYTAEFMGIMPELSMASDYSQSQSAKQTSLLKPTALEIDQQSATAYILTYSSVLKVEKQPQQSWADALLTGGYVVHNHRLEQAEGMTIDDKGKIWFTTEQRPAPLWVLPSYY